MAPLVELLALLAASVKFFSYRCFGGFFFSLIALVVPLLVLAALVEPLFLLVALVEPLVLLAGLVEICFYWLLPYSCDAWPTCNVKNGLAQG